MLRNAILASSLLITTTGLAMANPAPYVGVNLGVLTNTSSNVANSATTNSNGQRIVSSSAANYRGVPLSLFAGYGGVISQGFYLAGEMFGTLGTANLSNSGSKLKTSYGYGASILPGYMLSDQTLVFARAGVVRSHFTSAHSTQTGGQFGLGMQTSLTQNVDLRGEYDFSAYGAFNNSIGRIAAPRSDAFNLGLVYKFE